MTQESPWSIRSLKQQPLFVVAVVNALLLLLALCLMYQSHQTLRREIDELRASLPKFNGGETEQFLQRVNERWPASAGERDKLVFAETNEYWTAPTIVAGARGFYEQVNLEVEVVKFPSGLAAKNAVLNGSADLGLVAITPVAIAGFQDEQITLLATYMKSDAIVKLVGHSPDGTLDPQAALQKTVGYVPGTISEIVFERLAAMNGVPRERISTATFRPTELIPAFRRGDIGAFVAWEPLPLQASSLSPDVATYLDQDLYTVSLNLVARRESVELSQREFVKFLMAVQLAIEWIKENPSQARSLVEANLGFTEGELQHVWDTGDYALEMNREWLIRQLEEEGAWASESGYAEGELPEFSEYVDRRVYDDFEEVR